MKKILGLDLGTNSIGWAIRDTALDENQFEKYGVTTFSKGVGEGKTGEFSLAAERTKHRSIRRLYQARKYRLWETLGVLIEHDYCPLSKEDLNGWRKYDKGKGYFRKYPIHAKEFEQWIRLDFDKDGKPDYTSPYQLRKELVEKKFELDNRTVRYKIGRAIYHIAQRRGFKSSRKNKKEEVEKGADVTTKKNELQLSEKRRSTKIEELLSRHDTATIGAAFAIEENLGNRIRLDWIQYTIRQHYKDEINKIFEVQGISLDSTLYHALVESKKNKNDGSIFFRRPLRSQKGLVGKCTLEPTKPRCPISHPAFEEFRAWSLLNNIKFRNNKENEWQELPMELKEMLYKEKFIGRTKDYFYFAEVREFIEKCFAKKGIKLKLGYNEKTINCRDKTNISGCTVSARLKNIFGDNWQDYNQITDEIRIVRKKDTKQKKHKVTYQIEDIWHILFSFQDEECVRDFAIERLNLDDEKVKEFTILWKGLPDGYSMLGLNAIKKIIPFLRKGFIYTEAVILANMPTVLGNDVWKENQGVLTNSIRNWIKENREEKQLLSIVNELISKWHMSDYKVGYKNSSYLLDEKDKRLILDSISKAFGEKTWANKSYDERDKITKVVTYLYQCFFQTDFEWTNIKGEKYYIVKNKKYNYYKSIGNGYYRIPHLLDYVKKNLKDKFETHDKQLDKLYHPSQIEIYPKAKVDKNEKIFLQDPKTGSFKNPMAMRTLYELRKLINHLIDIDAIDDETEIVVEVARELNDANKRWAIETYQHRREEENKEFAKAISELLTDPELVGKVHADPNSNDDIDKFRSWYEQIDYKKKFKKEPAKNKFDENGIEIENNDRRKHDWSNIRNEMIQRVLEEKDLIKKYRLWKEQQCRCMYTGRLIMIADLFAENVIDFEHTIPRSISFDNSLANLTVCFADYNRNIKKNRIPTTLENYDNEWNGYSAIKPRLDSWAKRIEELKGNIEFWKKKSKQAQEKESKDVAIRQRHLWQLELDYWENKYERFVMTEVKTGFKNSQLVDTQLISKYAFHYLKTVFNSIKVQKGNVTAEFRKIYEIQPNDEEKNRDKHFHHAVDAAVLTLIPSSVKREEILQKSYEHYERWEMGKIDKKAVKQYHEKPYPHFSIKHIQEIEKNILINNIARFNALTPAKKIVRKRGRIVYLRDKEGELILDEKGEKKIIINTGDSIRGELHQATFFGAIKKHIRDENGNPKIDEDGKFLLEKELFFAVREPFVYKKDATSPGFKSLEEIKSCIVDPHVYKIIETQVGDRSLKEAIEEGIWMVNRDGEKVNRIRHIRIYVRGKEPLKIKRQTYLSEKYEYKNFYYAGNATSFLYALYEDEKGVRGFEPLNLFVATKIRKELLDEGIVIKSDGDFFEETKIIGRGRRAGKLITVLKPDLKVIFYKGGDKDEPKHLPITELSKRLYYIKNLFDAKTGTVQFQHHLEARGDKELTIAFPKEQFGQRGKNGFSEFNYDNPWPRLLFSPINFDFLIEKKDFNISLDGKIIFKAITS